MIGNDEQKPDPLLRWGANMASAWAAYRQSHKWVIASMVMLGIALLGGVLVQYSICCGSSCKAWWCEHVNNNPPWTLLTALVTAPALIMTWVWREGHKREDLRIATEGQVTERFTRAIEQLGHAEIAIRLGGIYALERIAKDSPRDHWPIMETLTAFVRQRAPLLLDRREEPEPEDAEEVTSHSDLDADASAPMRTTKPSIDIQAALSVVGRRDGHNDLKGARLSLRETALEGADLGDAQFAGFDLSWASLRRADLRHAVLAGAILTNTDLVRAQLFGANLRGALGPEVRLTRANLVDADLSGASLPWARLERADLMKAHLNEARLPGADLAGANLHMADLSGAHMAATKSLTNGQFEHVILSSDTTLPHELAGLLPPRDPPTV